MKFKSICILGLGYIGLPTASTFAIHGVSVVGVDVNSEVVRGLQNGSIHIFEPGLFALVQEAFQSRRLTVSTQVPEADAFVIAVPTPFHQDKSADLGSVISAAEMIVPRLKKGNLVVLESTSPPLTTLHVVRPILEMSGLKAGEDFFLAYSPERVLPGHILQELVENARIIGGVNKSSADAGRELYSTFVRGEIILTDATTAEMVKLMENTFRDVNIAIANEFSRLADRFGVDVWEAIRLANRHPRVKILNPGPGVGGHCISVDPWFLVQAAPDLTSLIRMAREVNDSQPDYVAQLVRRAMCGLQGKTVAVLGLAYKPDVDDLRESPAIEVVHLLIEAGLYVQIYEPFKPDFKVQGAASYSRYEDAVKGADALLLLVGHEELRNLDPENTANMTAARIAIDCVNGWQQEAWRQNGFTFYRLGVGRELI